MGDIRKLLSLVLVVLLAFGTLALAGCNGEDDAEDTGTETETEEGTDEDEETSEEEDEGEDELTGTLRIEGSDTVVNVSQNWAEQFMNMHPGVNISVKGGGSGTGIASLINGTADFANASRQIKDSEVEDAEANGITPVEHRVGIDGIAVVVNPDNPVEDLTIEDLGKIYRGEITDWGEVGGDDGEIVVLSRDSSSGTYGYFKGAVVDPEDSGLEYAADALLLASNQAIIDETTGNENGIGYVGLGYVNDEVKVVAVDGVKATVESAGDGSYPISRFLYMYSDGEPSGLAAAFLEWVKGPEGQSIVEDEGFVGLDDSE